MPLVPLHVVWFKRDLRVRDHRPLAHAAAEGPILPLFIAEPELWAGPDMSARQWAFVAECLEELRSDLAALGQPLVVRVGSARAVLEGVRKSHGVAGLWSHEETGNGWTYARDLDVAAWARAHGVPWRESRQSGVIRKLKTRDGWARAWDRFMGEPVAPPPDALVPLPDIDPGPIPTARDLGLLDDPCPERQAGGRRAAQERLTSFLAERGETYRSAMSSPVSGSLACSRLSPHLAWGTISMRETAQSVWARQRALKEAGGRGAWRGAMVSFSGRLHWRDHFTQKLEDEPRLEFEPLHPAYRSLRPRAPDQSRLSAWSCGQTGLPFVDACMRCLMATGWMNFRMRAMLMAVATYHLWLDWRAPGERLARLFTDYEPGIHWPQAQMQSGVTGINTVRVYNPVKQGYDQDPTGAFIRTWLPELASVPDKFVHEPWRWEGAGAVLDAVYPAPIVDHLAAAKEARAKVWAVRKGSDYRREADRVQAKHGSRKSGMRMTGRSAVRARPKAQLDLPLAEGTPNEDA
ncbi:MAG: deoxyribodipyrimidine photo-lyase [Pseudomonadota bacterium]